MGKHALLVIDCQNYFFDKNSTAFLPDSKRIMPKINALIRSAGDKIWPVIYTAHTAPSRPGNLMAERWEHLPSGWESEYFDRIDVVPGAVKIRKEHFSAFFRTKLDALLKKEKITHLVICGVMTHLCVDTTVRHGFMLGYRSTIITDACCSKSKEYHRAALLALKHGFCRTCNFQEFRKSLEKKECHSRGVGNP